MLVSSSSSDGGTSLSLLERARARDDEAWRRLVQVYSPLVFFWARRAGLNDSSAADLVQNVWCAVTTALTRFHRDGESGTFRGWLWTITRNKVRDHFREQQLSPEVAGGSEARQVLENVPEDEPTDETGNEDHGLLHRSLDLIRPEFEERTWRA